MPIFLSAQMDSIKTASISKAENVKPSTGIFKVSLTSIALKNYHFQYEHALSNKFSVSVSYRFQPYGTVPLKQYLENAIDDPSFKIGDFKMGNNAITPEVRYYFKGNRMKGFYVAGYARIANFELQVPVEYQSTLIQKIALLTGNFKSTSGGIMFGSQFNLGKSFVLDWWILGGHYGAGSGDLIANFSVPLTTQEQNDLRSTLSGTNLGIIKTTSEVTANYAKITASGPWAGVRAFGLSLGFKF